jgi:hypothetical protein
VDAQHCVIFSTVQLYVLYASFMTDLRVLVPISLIFLCLILLYSIINKLFYFFFPSCNKEQIKPPARQSETTEAIPSPDDSDHENHQSRGHSHVQSNRNPSRIIRGSTSSRRLCDPESLDATTDSSQHSDYSFSSSHNLLLPPDHHSHRKGMVHLIRQQIQTVSLCLPALI